MRVLARPVHVAQGERGELELVELAVGVQIVADSLLGDSVRRQRMLRLALTNRQVALVGVAVDRATARREHDLLRPADARAFEHVEAADDVDLGVEHGPLHRHPDVHLRSQMKHDLGSAPFHEGHHVRRADVERVDTQRPLATAPGIGEVGERARAQVVDDVDLVALGQQAVHQRRTDEAGAAGHECSHASTTLIPSSTAPSATDAPGAITQ